MAQTFLIAAPKKSSKGKFFRIVKDRSWNDMPWDYLVQVSKTNYEMGRDRTRWVYTDKCSTLEEAQAIFTRKTK